VAGKAVATEERRRTAICIEETVAVLVEATVGRLMAGWAEEEVAAKAVVTEGWPPADRAEEAGAVAAAASERRPTAVRIKEAGAVVAGGTPVDTPPRRRASTEHSPPTFFD
jgi:hypothetical protein